MEFDYAKFYGYLMQFFFPLMAILTGLFIWATYPAMTRKIFSTPLFLGREKEIRQLINKIRTGQSGVIIGIFGQERTEILTCLRDRKLYGHEANNLIFSYVDISTLEKNCTPEQFWKKALRPLWENISQTHNNSILKKINSDCQTEDFSQDYLDGLFEEINQANLRLVLLLDRFHEILHKDSLNGIIFLGKLRSLSSVYSSLCLVITTHKSLKKLHKEIIQNLEYLATSPFFNFLDVGEISLGVLSEADQNDILKKFEPSDEAQTFLKNEVGRHPYLLKIVTNHLTEAYEAGEQNPIEVTRQYFNQQCKALLDEMLPTWLPKMCQVFVQIAQGRFSNLDDDTEELEELKSQGLIIQENDHWQVLSPVFVNLLKEQEISKRCSKEK